MYSFTKYLKANYRLTILNLEKHFSISNVILWISSYDLQNNYVRQTFKICYAHWFSCDKTRRGSLINIGISGQTCLRQIYLMCLHILISGLAYIIYRTLTTVISKCLITNVLVPSTTPDSSEINLLLELNAAKDITLLYLYSIKAGIIDITVNRSISIQETLIEHHWLYSTITVTWDNHNFSSITPGTVSTAQGNIRYFL